MADFRVVQFRRGSTLQNEVFTGAQGELTVDTEKWCVIVHDGETPGGFPQKVEAVEYNRPRYLVYRAAAVQQGFASLGFSAPTNNMPTAEVVTESSGIITGVAVFAQGEAQAIQDHFLLPANCTALSLDVIWRTQATIGTAIWDLQTCCVPLGIPIEDVTFGPIMSIPEIISSTSPLAIYNTTIPIDITGYASGGEVFFQLTRDGGADTVHADIQLLSLRFTIMIQEK